MEWKNKTRTHCVRYNDYGQYNHILLKPGNEYIFLYLNDPFHLRKKNPEQYRNVNYLIHDLQTNTFEHNLFYFYLISVQNCMGTGTEYWVNNQKELTYPQEESRISIFWKVLIFSNTILKDLLVDDEFR